MTRESDVFSKAEAHNARGIELGDRGWWGEAVSEFKKAIALNPNSAPAWDNLATAYAETKQYLEALEAYLTSLRLAPENATAHFNLAAFLQMHGPAFAVTAYRRALALDPEYPDGRLNLGMALADQEQFDEALTLLTDAVNADPDDGLARHELASLLMERQQFNEAIAQLKEAARLEPEQFDVWLDLGVCYAQKGFFDEAEKAYRRAIDLEPKEVLAHYNLAALLAQRGQGEASLQSLQSALALDTAQVKRWLKLDPMFESLRGLPAFEKLR